MEFLNGKPVPAVALPGGMSQTAVDTAKPVVRLTDASFGYDAGQVVLRGVSEVVMPGETVALVGGSGSGKSTLIRLLMGLYPLTDGRFELLGEGIVVLADGCPARADRYVPQRQLPF